MIRSIRDGVMRHLSLFSGYEGLGMAVEAVFGAETVAVSDIDQGACTVLAHRLPDIPNVGDITTVDWARVAADLGPVDVISGGSPCQDLSTAGRRAGMKPGTRSGLWESMREGIAVLRPKIVVWENVRGALSAGAHSDLEHCPGCMGDPRDGGPVLRALGRVLGDLADLGFDAEWHSVRASDVGACHRRARVFVLAWRCDAADTHGPRLEERWRPEQDRSAHGRPRPTLGGSGREPGEPTDGHSVSIQDAMPLSVAVQLLPTPASADAERGPDYARAGRAGSGGDDLVTNLARLLPTPTTTQRGTDANLDTREGARANLHKVAKLAEALSPWGDYAAAIKSHEHLTGRPAPNPTELGPKGKPRLSARFVEWMMCLPDGWVTDVPGVTRPEVLKMLGSGVVPIQAIQALRVMLDRIEAS